MGIRIYTQISKILYIPLCVAMNLTNKYMLPKNNPSFAAFEINTVLKSISWICKHFSNEQGDTCCTTCVTLMHMAHAFVLEQELYSFYLFMQMRCCNYLCKIGVLCWLHKLLSWGKIDSFTITENTIADLSDSYVAN